MNGRYVTETGMQLPAYDIDTTGLAFNAQRIPGILDSRGNLFYGDQKISIQITKEEIQSLGVKARYTYQAFDPSQQGWSGGGALQAPQAQDPSQSQTPPQGS